MIKFWTKLMALVLSTCIVISLAITPVVASAQGTNLLSYEESIESLGSISLLDENDLDLINKSLDAIGARYFAPQYKLVTEALLSLSRGEYTDYGAIEASLALLKDNSAFINDYESNGGLAYVPLDSLIEYVQARKQESEGELQQAYDSYKASQVLDSLDRALALYPQLSSNVTKPTPSPLPSATATKAATKDARYAVITDGGPIDSNYFIQAIWDGVKAFAETNGIAESAYSSYIPKSSKSTDLIDEIQIAIDDGASVILLGGFAWNDSIVKVAKKYPDVCFLSYEVTAKKYSSNMINVNFAEEISGFLAGYATVKEGYTRLGFLGGTKVPAVMRYGYGFIQGADKAAIELNEKVTMNYWYSGDFSANDKITAKMVSWYTDGVEVIFSCGGWIVNSCVAAAEQCNGKVIGVDQDQSYLSETILTSACKLYNKATEYLLTQHNSSLNRWPSYMAGTNVRLSVEENAVGLPADDFSWRFENFTKDEYSQVLEEILQGKIKVSSSTSIRPKTMNVKMNFQ